MLACASPRIDGLCVLARTIQFSKNRPSGAPCRRPGPVIVVRCASRHECRPRLGNLLRLLVIPNPVNQKCRTRRLQAESLGRSNVNAARDLPGRTSGPNVQAVSRTGAVRRQVNRTKCLCRLPLLTTNTVSAHARAQQPGSQRVDDQFAVNTNGSGLHESASLGLRGRQPDLHQQVNAPSGHSARRETGPSLGVPGHRK